MNKFKIYVGNLSYSVTDQQVRDFFSKFGEITEVTVVFDRVTGRSKGFGFVTFTSSNAVNTAVSEANGQEFEGRKLKVNIAQSDGERRSSGGYGGGGGRQHARAEGNRGGWNN